MIDNHGRVVDYMRLAVTDKCNLRCFYCMPEEGIDFVKKSALLSFEENLRLIKLLAKEGLRKIRITGGEPFLRKDIMLFLKDLVAVEGIEKVAITTNGTLTSRYLDELENLGITSFNLSIDALDRQRFLDITKRDLYDTVWDCYKEILSKGFDLKLNCVVMPGRNVEDIIPLVSLSANDKVSIRFIEEMPFNGEGRTYENLEWNYVKILQHIEGHFEGVEKLEDPKNSTALNYKIKGFKGTFGIIPAYSRSFCGTCNRLRLTPTGLIKTCLYDNGVFSLRDLMRAGASDVQIVQAVKEAIGHRYKNGFEAEKNRKGNASISESMATIGG